MSIPFIDNQPTWVLAGSLTGVALWAAYDFLYTRLLRHETSSAFGTAAWAKHSVLKKQGLFGAEGIVLGRVRRRLLRQNCDKHLLTLAPNRAGKGVSSIIPNLLTWPGSVLVIDPKGENAVVTARRRREMGQAVFVLDPWNITGLSGARFNPLLALSDRNPDIVEDAALLADGLVISDPTGEEEFWNNEARALISGLLLHIVTTELPEERHLGTLRYMLTSCEDGFAEILSDMTENKSCHDLIARAARRMLQKTDKERSGVMSTAQAQTHFLDSPRMTKVLSGSSFDLEDMKAGNMTIYLVLPAERLATHGRWLRLIVSLCLAALTRNRTPHSKPVLFMLDEFAALGRLQAVETAMGLLAGYGVLLWPILQDLSQLQDLYPRRWKSFLANAGAVQAFGVNDLGTAEYLSGMLGQRTVMVRQHSRPGGQEYAPMSEHYGATSRPLMMPQEIMHLPPDKELLLLQGKAPIIARRGCYYSDKEFEGTFDPNPMIVRRRRG
ncbi:MAG: type IV secretory system conjugative DNA transfer family protein [Alphaproteobacteria bacterium]|nr:type IV secretory system conjugative DNA transfer family protein [Alphaproteobacteria bacterium]